MSLADLPVGTVTFLFTDIEGSTRLLKRLGGERYGEALADHQRILREAFAEHGGHEIDTQGDSFFVAFRRAKDAVSAAIVCQRRLAAHAWPEATELRVRMGIHTGEPAAAGERYVGLGVHRAARICAAGHGGQVLLSQTTRELLRDDPIPDVSVRDLGEHQLKDMDAPERIFQLHASGVRAEFPSLKTAAPTPFEGREGELAEAAAEEMTKRWRRPNRRVLIAATFGSAIVGISLGVLLTQGGGSSASASIAANAVGVLDSDSGKVVSEVPVGGAPGDVAVGPDAVWVTNVNDSTVSRIDPVSNQVVQTIPVGGGPSGVAFGGRAVWVANGLDGTVSRIDSMVNQEVQKVRVGNGPSGVAYGEGAVWVANSVDGTVSRIDPDGRRAPRAFPAAIGASGVAVGFGRVWVASPSTARVVVLDPRSGRVIKEIGVGGEPSAVAVGGGAVWVANRADGTVSRIDARAMTVNALVPVGRRPEGIAAGPEGVWVANAGDMSLVRLDPSTSDIVKTVPLDNPPRRLAMSPRGVYVAVQSTGIEHRGGTLRVAEEPDDTIDPGIAFGTRPWAILTAVYDGLVDFRRIGGVEGVQLVPNLSVAIPSPTDGGRTYTFELRQGIRYSDGRFVQPGDVKRAIERLFTIGSDAAPFYGGIAGADCVAGKPCDLDEGIVVDQAARTITFRLTAPDGDFLAKLALPFAGAVPPGTPLRDVGTRPIPATGPYRIASFRRKPKTVRLVRNEAFRAWSSDAQPDGYPDAITVSLRFASGPSASPTVERGAADVARGVSEEEVERLAVRYPDRLQVGSAANTFFFFLNTKVKPFDDVRVRRAVNVAFDREQFARRLGREFSPTCQILPPNSPGYRPVCPFQPGGSPRLDVARGLVRAAGAVGADVTVWVPDTRVEEGRHLVSTLESLGFDARVKAQEEVAHFTSISDPTTPAQTGFSGWLPDIPSAATIIPPQFGCEAERSSNPSGFCDPSIDAQMALASAAQAQDPATATRLWQEIELAVLAQAPIVPTYNRANVDFVSERVGNYQFNPQWGVLLDQLWVK